MTSATHVCLSGSTQDLYTSWDAIFDRTRATQATDSLAAVPRDFLGLMLDDHGEDSPGARRVGGDVSGTLTESSGDVNGDRAAASSRQVEVIASRRVSGDTRAAMSVAPHAMNAPLVIHRALKAAPVGAPAPSTQQESVGRTSPHTPGAAEQAHGTESVRVFLDGATVSIVVRNATLSPQAALRDAFETARELAGERAALQELTLNGRTLYRQDATDAACAPSATVVTFVC